MAPQDYIPSNNGAKKITPLVIMVLKRLHQSNNGAKKITSLVIMVLRDYTPSNNGTERLHP